MDSVRSCIDGTTPRYKVLSALILLTGLYLWLSTCSTLWDQDETFYARVAMEMEQSGSYLVPTFNGEPWLEKPSLLYWLMVIAIKFFGSTEFAFRFFSVLGSVLTWGMTFLIGRRLFGDKVALWSILILSTMTLQLVIGSSATTDAVLLTCVTATLWIFLQAFDTQLHIRHILLMGITMGLGMLTKGPVGLAPVPVILFTLGWLRHDKKRVPRYLGALTMSMLLAIVIFFAWAWPVNQATQGEFFKEFFGQHVFSRVVDPMEGHGGNWLRDLPYYLIVILAGTCPWTLYVPGAVSAVSGGRVGGRIGQAFLVSWIVPIVVIMTMAATKLPNYIFTIWPGLALAVSGTLVAAGDGTLTERDKKWLRRGIWFFGPMAGMLVLGITFGPWLSDLPGLRIWGAVSGIIYLAMTSISLYFHLQERFLYSAKILAVGTVTFLLSVMIGMLPALEQVKLSPALGRVIKERIPASMPIGAYRFNEPSLKVYTDRIITRLRGEDAVLDWIKQPARAVIIIARQDLNDLERQFGPLTVDIVDSVKGFDFNKGKPMEMFVLYCSGVQSD